MRARARAHIEELSSGRKTDSVSGSVVCAAESGVSGGLGIDGLERTPGAMPAGAMSELVDFEKNLNRTFESGRIG